MDTSKWRRRWKVAGICALLSGLIVLVFGQTVGHGFVNFDDNQYVYDNPIVSRGLSLEGIRWAFTHVLCGNWHPLTTISHLLDCQFYGLWPGGHHLTNLLLHLASAVGLFLVLREMTGATWRSGFVAAAFSIHPLRVESVAWVSERKDVLSGLLFMLTLWAYARYARRPESKGRYAMVFLWFGVGLMSKPMLVTVPFLLLLLDYWPLGRLRYPSELPRFLKEKLPLFALTVLSCLATVIAQKDALLPLDRLPLPVRSENALVATMIYLGKLVYPVKLAVLYPFLKEGWPVWELLAAILLLTVLSVGTLMLRRTRPFLVVGWFWYLGMLIPVIGIMQVGQQAYADRYTYLPQIGLWIALAWGATELAGHKRKRRFALGIFAIGALFMLGLAAYHQTAYWRNSETLWIHTLECTGENPIAHDNLGSALFREGRTEEALLQFRQALNLNPALADAQNNLAIALLEQGQTEQAIPHFREALRINPAFAEAHSGFGTALLRQARPEEAIAQYREALKINSGFADTHNNLGIVLLQQGRTEEAIAQYREALRIQPAYADAHVNLGNALLRQGRAEEAFTEYREALKLSPTSAAAHYNLSLALMGQGRTGEAIAQAEKALDLQPFNAAIQNNLALILATAPQAALRNGARAVEVATQANRSSGGRDPNILRTLAAAYAEAGEFSKAVQTAHRALELAEAGSNVELANKLRGEIKLYESGQRLNSQ